MRPRWFIITPRYFFCILAVKNMFFRSKEQVFRWISNDFRGFSLYFRIGDLNRPERKFDGFCRFHQRVRLFSRTRDLSHRFWAFKRVLWMVNECSYRGIAIGSLQTAPVMPGPISTNRKIKEIYRNTLETYGFP